MLFGLRRMLLQVRLSNADMGEYITSGRHKLVKETSGLSVWRTFYLLAFILAFEIALSAIGWARIETNSNYILILPVL